MLNINFFAENITSEDKNFFMCAVAHETCAMTIDALNNDISRINTRISNTESNKDLSEEKKKVALDELRSKLSDLQDEKAKNETELEKTKDVYNTVISAMTMKNANHFGNNIYVVKTVLRVLGCWNNSKLVKYAIIPAFQSPELYEALETIHITSTPDENGALILTDEVKTAYKKASAELETIIKSTFSLPFETIYTNKTRVKLTAEDKKLLNDCYVKGFRNKFDVDDKTGVVNFKERQINTLVKAKRNKKSGKMEYDYSGLASTIANIVMKHYFVA